MGLSVIKFMAYRNKIMSMGPMTLVHDESFSTLMGHLPITHPSAYPCNPCKCTWSYLEIVVISMQRFWPCAMPQWKRLKPGCRSSLQMLNKSDIIMFVCPNQCYKYHHTGHDLSPAFEFNLAPNLKFVSAKDKI
jgi:hypothetical protein